MSAGSNPAGVLVRDINSNNRIVACLWSGDGGRLAMAPGVLLIPGGLNLESGWLEQRAGQAVQQVVAGPEVGCAGPYPLAGDELEGGGGGGQAVEVEPHPH